jgi:outer membrane protein assembly factor BamB
MHTVARAPTCALSNWSLPIRALSFGSPAVAVDGTVYVGSAQNLLMPGKLYAVTPAGQLKWSFTMGSALSNWLDWPVVGADGTVYVCSDKLYAVTPAGKLKWNFTTDDMAAMNLTFPLTSSPAVGADGTVYVGLITRAGSKLCAVTPAGQLKWSFTTGPMFASSPAVGADGTVYVSWTTFRNSTPTDSKLCAVTPTGQLKWSFTTGGGMTTKAPAVGADGIVYVSSFDNKLYAVTAAGQLKWSFSTGDAVSNSPVVGPDGMVYFLCWDKQLYAVTPAGQLNWNFTTTRSPQFSSPPVVGADGTVYISDYDYLYAVTPPGLLKWNFTAGGEGAGSPAVGADGTVYVSSSDKLYAVTPRCSGCFAAELSQCGAAKASSVPDCYWCCGVHQQLLHAVRPAYLAEGPCTATSHVCDAADVVVPELVMACAGQLFHVRLQGVLWLSPIIFLESTKPWTLVMSILLCRAGELQ